MPSPSRRLRLDDVDEHLRLRGFSLEPPCRVGVEIELLSFPAIDASARLRPDPLVRALEAGGPLPGGSRVTCEPGGQLELSSPPHRHVADACGAAAADLAVARTTASGLGIVLRGLGADPLRPPRRVVDSPRYGAMEAYFEASGPAGRHMMCNTAALQVNVGLGPTPADVARQWRLAHLLGPTLAAAFANSPLVEGRPSGFRSTRMAAWSAIDRTRSRPVDDGTPGPDAWAAYALNAQVMLVRADEQRFVPLTTPLSLRRWVTEGHELGWPTTDDIDYHLSTLFPPVRPRGWLELRMVDSLPDPWWQVPVAVVAALLGDPEAGEAAARAATGRADRWLDAARTGLTHPGLAARAEGCFDAALDALERLGAARLSGTVAAYADRWVRRGRSPADDLLDAWADTGAVLARHAAEEVRL